MVHHPSLFGALAEALRSASKRASTSRVSMLGLTIFMATLRRTDSRCSATKTPKKSANYGDAARDVVSFVSAVGRAGIAGGEAACEVAAWARHCAAFSGLDHSSYNLTICLAALVVRECSAPSVLWRISCASNSVASASSNRFNSISTVP